MKIAMYGGTYDPIHYGHIALAERYVERLSLDRIYVVPTKTPPHKAAAVTDGELRLEMCRLAIDGLRDDRYEVSDIELRREGLSWSYYTVCSLLERCPGADFYLIVGADMFMTMETWHRFDELKQLVTVCTVPRDEDTPEKLMQYAGRLNSIGCRTLVMDSFEPVPISSTMIRNLIADGKSIDGLTPPQVAEFIKEHGLYARGKGRGDARGKGRGDARGKGRGDADGTDSGDAGEKDNGEAGGEDRGNARRFFRRKPRKG